MGGNLSSGVFGRVSVESHAMMMTFTPMMFERWISAAVPRRVGHGVILAMLCALVSCVTVPSRENGNSAEVKPQAPPPPVVTAAEIQNTERQKAEAETLEHIQKALSKLQVGQTADAKTELDVVFRRDPGNKLARSLLMQIQTDPARYFGGTDSFNYTLQQGDTLQSIAQRFLEEPLKFFILARFNGISDPSRVAPGRIIKVPGYKTGNAPPAAPLAIEETPTQRARRFHDTGKYSQAIETLEGSATGNGEARDLLAVSYAKYADELVQKQNLTAAQSQMEKALALQPNNEKLQGQLKQIEKQRDIMTNYKIGNDALAARDTAKALDAFNAVLKLNPWHEGAKKQIAAIKADHVESMHKDAMVEYNKQNLDQAIALWDRVLALLPTHQSARLYRARAVDLKTRLMKLEQR